MGEALNLATSAIGLATSIGTCVEWFTYIQDARRFNSNVQTELLTLELLKSRLSRWSDAVGIGAGQGPHFSQLKATEGDIDLARFTVDQILELLLKSEKVSTKYRIAVRSEERLAKVIHSVTWSSMDSVNNKMKTKLEKRKDRPHLLKRGVWALYHKTRYSNLVGDVTKLVDNLEQAFPAPKGEAVNLERSSNLKALPVSTPVTDVDIDADIEVKAANSPAPTPALIEGMPEFPNKHILSTSPTWESTETACSHNETGSELVLATQPDPERDTEQSASNPHPTEGVTVDYQGANKVVDELDGIAIHKLDVNEDGRVKNGNFVSAGWKGVGKLPEVSGRGVAVRAMTVMGNAKVMNGHTFGDKDSFWD